MLGSLKTRSLQPGDPKTPQTRETKDIQSAGNHTGWRKDTFSQDDSRWHKGMEGFVCAAA